MWSARKTVTHFPRGNTCGTPRSTDASTPTALPTAIRLVARPPGSFSPNYVDSYRDRFTTSFCGFTRSRPLLKAPWTPDYQRHDPPTQRRAGNEENPRVL